ncbi:MAG: C39 family peptidase [Erysipelotrichales bacterium]
MKKLKKVIFSLLIIFVVLNIAGQAYLSYKNYGLTIFDLYAQRLPKKDKINDKYPQKFLVKNNTTFDKQGLNQCAGYSSAYLLRMNGHKIKGDEVYNDLNYKFTSGYVMPQAIVKYFKDNNYNITMYKGSIEQLKMHVAKNKPVIVLINDPKVGLHYVNVIGYSDKNIFLADSLMNQTSGKYNNKYPIKEFESIWTNTNVPIYKQIYYVLN